MVLPNQYPWDLSTVRLTAVGDLADDDMIILFLPRSRDVLRFVRTMRQPPRLLPQWHRQGSGPAGGVAEGTRPGAVTDPAARPRTFGRRFAIQFRIEALAVVKGEHVCTNEEFRLTPLASTWITGQFGLQQTHASVDLVAACAGLAYGLSEVVRLLQEVDRPALLACAEKFSDKRHSAPVPDDLRRRRVRHRDRAGAVRRTQGHRPVADVRRRAGNPGELDHLAEPGLRQQHQRVRAGGQGTRRKVPHADDR